MAATMAEQIHVIENVPVSFPFTPYPCQIEYMEKVIKALQNNTNAILESPTGTGKTLSLLCATLSWRQQLPAPVISEWDLQSDSKGPLGGRPKIIYASRTHSQLSQAIHELKSTSYRPKVSIIGSRDQLCINSEVMSKDSNAEKVHACHAKVAAKSCTYYNNVDLKRLSVPEGFIPDIEELVGMGTKNKMCPYYLAREMKTEADLIFMPYNYILDLRTRLVHGINITNTVVILDEAHNIERVCEDSSSFELTSTDIAHCIKDIDYLLKNKYEEAKEYLSELDTQTQNTLKDLANLKELFLCLEDSLDKIELKSENNECVKPGSYIFEFLGKAGITTETHVVLIDQCSQAIASLTSDQSLHRTSTNLQKFLEAIKIVFSGSCPVGMTRERMASLHYRVYIKSDNNKRKKKSDVWTTDNNTDDTCRRLCYWCFNPGYAMTELVRQGVRSVILTSGTLSPLESFTSELQLEFPISLQGSHVIGQDQVWMGVVSKGPDNIHLNSSYQTRFTPAYMDSLGNTLVNFFRIIPDGVLVFFPSYIVMETLVTHWKEQSSIFMRMEQHKQVFKEPKFKNEFNSVMSAYYEKIGSADKVGGAFFGVCRGKVSEGLDFADNNGRAVIITGLPYPPFAEPKVQLKMEYLKDARSNFNRTELITDKQWYNQQATRAVNQAIGRVIRHKNDYGAIILCDERFAYSRGQDDLPLWLRPQLQKYDKFGPAQRDLTSFFKTAQNKYGHLVSIKNSLPDVKPDYTSGIVGGARGVVKLNPDAIFKDDDEIEDIDIEDYTTVSLSKNKTESRCDLLSSLKFDELHPVQPHHVAMAASRKREEEKRDEIPQTSQCLRSVGNSDSLPASKRKKIIIIDDKKSAATISSSERPSAQVFSEQLKSHLCKNSMSKFKRAFGDYNKTENIDNFLEVLKEIFRTPSTYNLFENVYHFIKKRHVEHFYEAYHSHTGKHHPLSVVEVKRETARSNVIMND